MNIKIMLNKDEEIKRLAADPEIEIKIKNAILDGVGKRVAKTIDKEALKNVEGTCRRYMEVMLKERGIEYNFYTPKIPKWLSDKIQKKVEDLLTIGIENCVRQTFDEMAKTQIEIAVAGKLQELASIDPTAEIKAAADRIIRQKLGR